jgi:hypothetical protein
VYEAMEVSRLDGQHSGRCRAGEKKAYAVLETALEVERERKKTRRPRYFEFPPRCYRAPDSLQLKSAPTPGSILY